MPDTTYTLADYEATAPNDLTRAVVRTWREVSPIMDMMSFKPSDNLTENIMRYNDVPTVPWRKIGETFTDLKVRPDFLRERLFFLGAKIDVPYEYVKAKSLIDQRAEQEEAIMKGVAYSFNQAFFLNTPIDDEDAIVGLWYRLKNDFAAPQSVDASGLDISPDTATTNISHRLFDLLDNLLSQVDGEDNQKVLFMNKTVKMRAQSLMRQSNILSNTVDQLGRKFDTYGVNGAKLVDAGYRNDQSTYILPDTESADGTALTGGAKSSIFCVRFGEPFVAGWNQEAPMAEDVGLLEARTHFRTVVRGSAGIYISNPRAIARAYDIVAA